MNSISIRADGLAKDFNRRSVFKDISFSVSNSQSLAITGRNGAGKSTLAKVIAGLLGATRGRIQYSIEGKQVDGEIFKHQIGFVSPYLNLYDEFSAIENLQLLSKIRSAQDSQNAAIQKMLELVGLWKRRNDLTGTFSSGMKQRLKYAFALLHEPAVLILDEPTSNLDADGISMVREIANRQKKHGILLLATNDREEALWCDQSVRVDEGL